jgi:hypothetical protein
MRLTGESDSSSAELQNMARLIENLRRLASNGSWPVLWPAQLLETTSAVRVIAPAKLHEHMKDIHAGALKKQQANGSLNDTSCVQPTQCISSLTVPDRPADGQTNFKNFCDYAEGYVGCYTPRCCPNEVVQQFSTMQNAPYNCGPISCPVANEALLEEAEVSCLSAPSCVAALSVPAVANPGQPRANFEGFCEYAEAYLACFPGRCCSAEVSGQFAAMELAPYNCRPMSCGRSAPKVAALLEAETNGSAEVSSSSEARRISSAKRVDAAAKRIEMAIKKAEEAKKAKEAGSSGEMVENPKPNSTKKPVVALAVADTEKDKETDEKKKKTKEEKGKGEQNTSR